MNQVSLIKIMLLSRNWAAPCSAGMSLFLYRSTTIITLPPNVSSQGDNRMDGLVSGSGTSLVLKGWATRVHCVRIACRAPAHCPGPVRRYWYGVQGPKKIFTQSTGSLRSSIRRFGRTPTCKWKSLCPLYVYGNTVLYKAELNWPPWPWNPGRKCNLLGEQPVVGRDSWESKGKERIHLYDNNTRFELNFDLSGEMMSTFSCFSFSQTQWPPAFSPLMEDSSLLEGKQHRLTHPSP